MSQGNDTLRQVSWLEVFPGLRLFSALWIALHHRAMILAVLGLVLTTTGWQVFGWAFWDTQNQHLRAQIEGNNRWPWERTVLAPPISDLITGDAWRLHTPVVTVWREISMPFEQIYFTDSTFVQFAYWCAGALWSLAVWAFFGGAITRLAAVSFARQENQTWGQAAGFARSRWVSFFVAPLFPLLTAFVLAGLLAIVGSIMRSDVGVMIAAVLWPFVLVFGFFMAFVLIGLFVGWPLMWGTISAEGTDSFGALSHSYSYAYQRPVRYFVYVVVAAVIGVLGWYAVSLFAQVVVELSWWGISWGSGVDRMHAISSGSTSDDRGVQLIAVWNRCVYALPLVYIYSYFWSATTVIYFLLRQAVDAKELDEVYLPEERQLHGLPALKSGADGVPEPSDDLVE
jgi:hypothetical protein